MGDATHSLVAIALAIVGVAIIAVLVSKNTQTAKVIQAGASGFGNVLGVAISPATGGQFSPNTSYPS